MPLPRQRAHIVGEDEILEIAGRAELDARHDVVELETEFRETRLANQHDGAAADQVGDDFARDMRQRGLLLLLASAERERDRVESEKHGHRMADLQHGTGKFEPGSTAPGIPRGHVEQERMVFRAGQGVGEVVVRFAGRDRRYQPATEEKTEQENDDPLHGYDLAPARWLRRLDVLLPESATASMAVPLTWSRGHRSIARKTRRARSVAAREGEGYRCCGCYGSHWHWRWSRAPPLPRPATTGGRSDRSAWSYPSRPAAARTSLRAS